MDLGTVLQGVQTNQAGLVGGICALAGLLFISFILHAKMYRDQVELKALLARLSVSGGAAEGGALAKSATGQPQPSPATLTQPATLPTRSIYNLP